MDFDERSHHANQEYFNDSNMIRELMYFYGDVWTTSLSETIKQIERHMRYNKDPDSRHYRKNASSHLKFIKEYKNRYGEEK